ncbi:MAG: efflux RND transporter permease subunit [Planctomycetes bacterium]|nr:efflux RND transporter permease subunit [Planctomycetota bacterium]
MNDPTLAAPPLRRGLIGAFVDRPVTSLMVTLAIVVIGIVAIAKLPLRFLPGGMAENQINVWIPVPQNQAPQEVQEKVVEPLAESIRTIPGLQRLRTRAGAGGAWVSARLDEGMDPGLAAAEVRDRVQRAMPSWPPGVDRYFTWKEDGGSAPLAFLQFLTPKQDAEWNHKLDQIVRTRLEAVDGVGRIDLWGLLDQSIRIWIHRDKLLAHQVDYASVLRKLQTDNFAMPVGELHVDEGRQSHLVRVDVKFRSSDDIAELPIRQGLKLGDIATIERRPEVRDELSRFDGKYTCTAVVRGAADANPVAASDGLHAALTELEADPRLQGLASRWLFDQGAFIREGLGNLVSTALQGGALALLVLWFFLRNLAMTAVIAMAIPLTLLIAGSQMYFGNMSLDICTMAGLTLAVGMVVDNAVVVIENIRRLREQGHSVRDACIGGAREVGMAVTMSTLTSVVVFLPMAFLGSRNSQVLMGSVGIPLSTALLGSLAVALLLMPAAFHALRGGGKLADAGLGKWSPLGWLLAGNRALLRFGLRHRIVMTLGGVGLLATMALAWNMLEAMSGGGGPFKRGDITVHYTMPRGTDLVAAQTVFQTFERHSEERKQEWGIAHVGGRFGKRSGRIELFTADKLPKAEQEALRTKVLASWPKLPGVQLEMGEKGGGGMRGRSEETEKDDRNFVVRLYGRDSEYLLERANALLARLRALPEVEHVDVPAIEDRQEVIVELDRERAEEVAIRPENVLGTMSSGLQGREVGRFEESDREVRLIAQFDAREKPALVDLQDTRVLAAAGSFQRLQDLARIGFRPTVQEIEAQDGRVNVVLVGRRHAQVTTPAMTQALAATMAGFPLAPGYAWSEESSHRQASQDIAELLRSMVLSIVLIFLLMGVLFESVILPASILVTIPFALLGATWSLALFSGQVDPMAIIGMVILCGVVVNNGIVLLDHIERLRRGGMDRTAAIGEGVRVRMRPIFMTAATTFVGLLPMAVFGDDAEGISYKGLSIAVAGGLLVSTVFTAVAVPLCYTFVDDLGRLTRLALQRAVAR